MTAGKKITGISFLLLPMLPAMLFIITQLQSRHIYSEMKERLEKENLCVVAMPVSELHWVKEGKEALINGEMFDVHSVLVINGRATLAGLYDEKETELKEKTMAFQKKTQEKNAGSVNAALFLLSFFDNSQFTVSIYRYQLKLTHTEWYHHFVANTYIDKETPPPDNC